MKKLMKKEKKRRKFSKNCDVEHQNPADERKNGRGKKRKTMETISQRCRK